MRMPDLKLFDGINHYLKIMKISESKDSSRSDKIFLKKLYEYNQEVRETYPYLSKAIEEIMANLVRSHKMAKYYSKLLN